MITITCPECGKIFYDYAGENCIEDDKLKNELLKLYQDEDKVEDITYDRLYKCPECGEYIDLSDNYHTKDLDKFIEHEYLQGSIKKKS